jgi:hypothetical protein
MSFVSTFDIFSFVETLLTLSLGQHSHLAIVIVSSFLVYVAL